MPLSRMCSVLAAVAVFLFGCAGAAAQTDLSSIKRVAIDPEVPQPDIPLIQSPGNFKAFMVGGGIGAAIDQNEAARLTGLSAKTLERHAAAGELVGRVKVGRRVLFVRTMLETWLGSKAAPSAN